MDYSQDNKADDKIDNPQGNTHSHTSNQQSSNTAAIQRTSNNKGYDNVIPYKFKQGQTGNPLGKPKGAVNFSTRFKQKLALVAPDDLPNAADIARFCQKSKVITNNDVLDAILLHKALVERDLNAINSLLDRTEGKPKQQLSMDASVTVSTFAEMALAALEAEQMDAQTVNGELIEDHPASIQAENTQENTHTE